MGRYSHGSDRAFWLEAWNGGSYTVERMGRPPVELDYLLIGITGGLQPDKLAAAFGGDNDGMTARFLYSWPTEPEHQRLSNAVSEVEALALAALTKLARFGNVSTVEPRSITLSNEARELFETLRARVYGEKKFLDGMEREYQSKIPAHVLRLAGTLMLIDWAFDGGNEPDVLQAPTMRAAISLATEYFWPHARSVLRQTRSATGNSEVRRVLRWIRATGASDVTREQIRCDALAKSLNSRGHAGAARPA